MAPTGETIRDTRCGELVRAAYQLIVAEGLEGLRTRSIASRAGVNVSTLHYYFPSKEALIGGVVEFVMSELRAMHGPRVGSKSEAIGRLRQEFSDVRFYRTSRPDLVIAIQEFFLRARRDRQIAEVVERLQAQWNESI